MSVTAKPTYESTSNDKESLFERFSWFYAFCREHLFRDDTKVIAAVLWSQGAPPPGSRLIELGCGPGFYACRLAERYRQVQVVGIDRLERQLSRARQRARASRLHNCEFEQADVLALRWATDTFDGLIVSRLFLILREKEQALSEMYRVLRPGGRCFIAEPRSALGAGVPLRLLWLIASTAQLGQQRKSLYREPAKPSVLSASEFGCLVESQPWHQISRWQDLWYQYAVCEKGAARSKVGAGYPEANRIA